MQLESTVAGRSSRWLTAAALVAALLAGPGCASTSGNACSGCPEPEPCCPTFADTDLPPDPDPCLEYCKVWVPPVYREVPRLERVCGCVKRVERIVDRTEFCTVQTKPARAYGCVTPSCECDEVAVEVCPGGYRWKQLPNGCWRYCDYPPKYRWCKKQVREEGIEYCMCEPAE